MPTTIATATRLPITPPAIAPPLLRVDLPVEGAPPGRLGVVVVVVAMTQSPFRRIDEGGHSAPTDIAGLAIQWTTIAVVNLFAEQDKHLSKVNTTTRIVVQARLLLMKKKAKSSSDHITK